MGSRGRKDPVTAADILDMVPIAMRKVFAGETNFDLHPPQVIEWMRRIEEANPKYAAIAAEVEAERKEGDFGQTIQPRQSMASDER